MDKGQRLLLALVIFLVPALVLAENSIASGLNTLFKNSSDRIGFAAFDVTDQKEIFSYRQEEEFIPASVLKLLTSYAALKELGSEYSFKTSLYAAKNKVYVVAGGNPVFTTEDLEIFAREVMNNLKGQSIDIILDSSEFASNRPRMGQRAYEAGGSPMLINFNSIRFEVCPNRNGGLADVRVAPYEYPVNLNGSIKTVGSSGIHGIDELSQGQYRLSGTIGSKQGCVSHYRSVSNPDQYFLQMLTKRLEQLGVKVNSSGSGKKPADARLLYTHNSPPLRKIVEDLNKYSTNVIAEMLVTALGYSKGTGFSHKQGVSNVEHLVKKRFKQPAVVLDGSGLNSGNRITPLLVLRLLREVEEDNSMNAEFVNSLSVLGRNGTLKSRGGARSPIVRAKTGSLTGVSSIAGYLYTPKGKELAFVLIQNGSGNRSVMLRRESKMLELLNTVK